MWLPHYFCFLTPKYSFESSGASSRSVRVYVRTGVATVIFKPSQNTSRVAFWHLRCSGSFRHFFTHSSSLQTDIDSSLFLVLTEEKRSERMQPGVFASSSETDDA